MTTFEQTLLREVATLPVERQADVLAFVRFLKISLPDSEKVRQDFREALNEMRETAQRLGLTEEDIEEEIRAVRADKQ